MTRAAVVGLVAVLGACGSHTATTPPPPSAAPPTANLAAGAPRAACVASVLAPPAPVDPDTVAEPTGTIATPTHAADLCEMSVSNLARAEHAILGGDHGPPGAHVRWDHRSTPAGLAAITTRFALPAATRTLLADHGFAVAPAAQFASYTEAFHEIFESQLPLYVSIDAVLQAVFIGNDRLIADLERGRLVHQLDAVLGELHCALAAAAADYPAQTAHDLDVYLTVARSLLADHPVPAVLDGAAEAAPLVAAASAGSEVATVTLFGRIRRIDFTQYTPRGHYGADSGLTPYFRAAMWLSRLEFNLVSRSSASSAATQTADPRETPREALDALALADLATRAHAAPAIATLDAAWAALAGAREDVSLAQLGELRATAHIADLRAPDAFAALKAAIGERFVRTTKLHLMPDGTTALPVIATLLGPRVVADAHASQPLVEPQTPGRYLAGALDAAYALGADRARSYLAADLAKFPTLGTQLERARAIVAAAPAGPDLYGAWLAAVRALATPPTGTLPSFMATPAFADLRLGETIAAYGQLRHNYVLLAGESYSQGGCEIPDAWVEPAPAVYDALLAYVDREAALVGLVGGAADVQVRLAHQRATLEVLRAIGADELAGRALSDEQRRWLGQVVEITPETTGGPATFTGWYFGLFADPPAAAMPAAFVADVFTDGNDAEIAYAGATAAELGVFVVDTGGPPRAFAGPVAHTFTAVGPLAKRYADPDVATGIAGATEPWSASYRLPAVAPPPALAIALQGDNLDRLTVHAARELQDVHVELLDHHRAVLRRLTVTVGTKETAITVPVAHGKTVEAIHVAVGAWNGWLPVTWAGGYATFGGPANPDDQSPGP